MVARRNSSPRRLYWTELTNDADVWAQKVHSSIEISITIPRESLRPSEAIRVGPHQIRVYQATPLSGRPVIEMNRQYWAAASAGVVRNQLSSMLLHE
jgi:hypothetical protein